MFLVSGSPPRLAPGDPLLGQRPCPSRLYHLRGGGVSPAVKVIDPAPLCAPIVEQDYQLRRGGHQRAQGGAGREKGEAARRPGVEETSAVAAATPNVHSPWRLPSCSRERSCPATP